MLKCSDWDIIPKFNLFFWLSLAATLDYAAITYDTAWSPTVNSVSIYMAFVLIGTVDLA